VVDIDLIVPNPEQPRASMEPKALEELASSIREHGILQPIVVSEVASGTGVMTYQLIAGERRLQAARMAGVSRMPVVIREAAGAELLEIALIENMLRVDLNPVEEAKAFRRLNEEFGIRQEHIAKRTGMSRGAVSNSLRLLSLPKEIQDSIIGKQITEGHARALLGIEDERARMDAWRKIVGDELSVRQAEEIAKALRAGASPTVTVQKKKRVDPNVRAIEDDLRHALGMPVTVRRGKRGGSITIKFFSDEELEGILQKVVG
jgi:ParB family chromosome partitioning protein